jgi:CRP/FNR family cyclic AMP-dependent transcriptional regulator
MPTATRTPARGKNPAVSDLHLALLRNHPIFGEIGADRVRQLCVFATVRKVHGGATIFAKGDPGAALFAVRKGSVKISVPAIDGREAVFNVLREGEIFGEIALLDGLPRTADAVALTDCELMVIDRRDFLAFVQSEPKVAMRLIELLCARLRFASEHMEEMFFLDVPARLARALLRLGAGENRTAAERVAITQQEISRIVGISRESVNKLLRKWEKHGLVQLERGAVVVRDPAKIAALAAQESGSEP